ncbi:MAG: bifunctional acetate--CoA ligase family protein/GNAT family N-acetyltransferase [Phycisphaerales bacterium]
MSIRHLDAIFKPKRVAVVGASDTSSGVGYAVLHNMIAAGFDGVVYPVNAKRESVQGIAAYKSVLEVPSKPDLAVICTPAPTVLGVVQECAQAGIRGVVIISAGFRETGEEGLAQERAIRDVARKHHMRIVGPNCLGVITPRLGLNASFTVGMPGDGHIAFISQSGALGTSVLDWAERKGIGLSHFVSVGNMMDVGFPDLIDYFGQDPRTRALILYIESIRDARRFVSAARAFTRKMPIIAYKAGRFAQSAAAAASHTGALMGADDVHDAAFRRAGIERVFEIDDLFDCAELLARQKPPRRGRLAIVTNAGGPGVMATDALLARDGELAELQPETIEKLNACLPPAWSHSNPVDVLGDATSSRYADAIKIVREDPGVDALLTILTPQAMTDDREVARVIGESVASSNKPVLGAWLGGNSVMRGREILTQHNIPSYPSPERAIRGFMHLVSYARNIETQYETPGIVPIHGIVATHTAGPLADKPDTTLSEIESKKLFKDFGIPVAMAEPAENADQAVSLADAMGYPVVMKIRSPQITHKTDVDGVALSLEDADAVRAAFARITASAAKHRPDAHIQGVSVQPMVEGQDGVEMILGVKKDPVFGLVLLAGMGGVTAELLQDRVLGMPPLTERLARRMLETLRCWPLLNGYRGRPRVDVNGLIEVLIRLSYLVAETPNIKELDVNPLLVTPKGVTALDARVITDDTPGLPDPHYLHLAIRPYPTEFVQKITLEDGQEVTFRPIRPEDEPRWHELLASCSAESLRARFFSTISKTTHEMATRYCYIDYDREMAIVAIIQDGDHKRMVGVGRLVADPDHTDAEYAILVADKWQGHGLGNMLTAYCLQLAKRWGIQRVYGGTAIDNRRMIATFREQGFDLVTETEEGMVLAERPV